MLERGLACWHNVSRKVRTRRQDRALQEGDNIGIIGEVRDSNNVKAMEDGLFKVE